MNKESLESLKEGLRTFLLGEIPVIIGVLAIIKSGINVELGTFIISWNVALASFIVGTIGVFQTALASAVDKWLHIKDIKTMFDLRGLDKFSSDPQK